MGACLSSSSISPAIPVSVGPTTPFYQGPVALTGYELNKQKLFQACKTGDAAVVSYVVDGMYYSALVLYCVDLCLVDCVKAKREWLS